MTVDLDVTTRSWCLKTKVSEKGPACILLYSKDETRRVPEKLVTIHLHLRSISHKTIIRNIRFMGRNGKVRATTDLEGPEGE